MMNRVIAKFSHIGRSIGIWRYMAGVVLLITLMASVIAPTPVHAQFGLLGGIESIVNLIHGAIQNAMNFMGAVSQSLQALYQQTVWPVQLINEARNMVASLVAQFRGGLHSIYSLAINSATLPVPIALESVIRDRQTNDFGNLTDSYYQSFGALSPADQADSLSRKMIDIDDTLALDTLKTLKATDQAADLVLQSGNRIEDEAQVAAPGSAPFLTASATVANLQSQAMMQRMLAAMLRQEAARVAHGNALRKRDSTLVAKARQSITDVLRRP
jgi:hypothetical protein